MRYYDETEAHHHSNQLSVLLRRNRISGREKGKREVRKKMWEQLGEVRRWGEGGEGPCFGISL